MQTERRTVAYRSPVTRAAVIAAGIVVAALLGAADGAAGPTQNPKLVANVGPSMEISLRTASGAAVTRLAPGTYDIEVTDQSEFHNFQVTGPGVSEQTGVETTGTATWTVTFGNGTSCASAEMSVACGAGNGFGATTPTFAAPANPYAVASRFSTNGITAAPAATPIK